MLRIPCEEEYIIHVTQKPVLSLAFKITTLFHKCSVIGVALQLTPIIK